MIPLESAHQTRAQLEDWGYPLEYHEYEMPHTITQDVINDLTPWLKATLPPKGS